MPMKPSLCATTIVAFGLAVSAVAFQSQAREIYVRGAHDAMPGVVYSHHDPYGAYYGKHKLGRDPDPNVRESIINSHRFEKGAY